MIVERKSRNVASTLGARNRVIGAFNKIQVKSQPVLKVKRVAISCQSHTETHSPARY
jgi:hypothetical protein